MERPILTRNLPRTWTSHRPGRRTVIMGLGALAVGGAGAVWAQGFGARNRPPPHPIEIEARPIASFERVAPNRHSFERLEFRGGLVLQSRDGGFGGWSGMAIEADGRRLLMVSDRGSWLTADLVYDGTRPHKMTNAVIGPIEDARPGSQGGRFDRIRDYDAESVTVLDGNLSRGRVLIAFERTHRIGIFGISEQGLAHQSGQIALPVEAQRLPPNRGLEAITVLRGGRFDGSVVAFAEEPPGGQGDPIGWLWPGGAGGTPLPIGLANMGGFAVTDLAALPGGGLIVLERRFRFTEGVRMRLRLIEAGAVRPGARLIGRVLLAADQSYEIDNMEGLSIHRDGRGRTILTLVSDNNFNPLLQRTVLLQFALSEVV
jgi:hypothetical protein